MLVRVYIDMGRVSDTPESAETVISKTILRNTQMNNTFKLTPALSRFPQLLLTAHRKNTSEEVLPCIKPIFRIRLFLNP